MPKSRANDPKKNAAKPPPKPEPTKPEKSGNVNQNKQLEKLRKSGDL